MCRQPRFRAKSGQPKFKKNSMPISVHFFSPSLFNKHHNKTAAARPSDNTNTREQTWHEQKKSIFLLYFIQ